MREVAGVSTEIRQWAGRAAEAGRGCLRLILRDCAVLSAVLMPLIFVVPRTGLITAPSQDMILFLVFGPVMIVVVARWVLSIWQSIRGMRTLVVLLAAALPFLWGWRGLVEGRRLLGNVMGLPPDAFPATLRLLSLLAGVELVFALTGGLLMLVALVLTVSGRFSGFWIIFPAALLLTLPLWRGELVPRIPDLARALDSQSRSRCDFGANEVPEAITFLSDSQVLGWRARGESPVVLPCRLMAKERNAP